MFRSNLVNKNLIFHYFYQNNLFFFMFDEQDVRRYDRRKNELKRLNK